MTTPDSVSLTALLVMPEGLQHQMFTAQQLEQLRAVARIDTGRTVADLAAASGSSGSVAVHEATTGRLRPQCTGPAPPCSGWAPTARWWG